MRTALTRVAACAGVALLLTLGAVSASVAQSASPIVKARMVLSTDAVHSGETTQAAVLATIAPGFHINAHHPTLNYLIPTALEIKPGKVFAAGPIHYPEGHLKRFVFAEKGLSVYQGAVVIRAAVHVARNVAPGDYPLQGELQYQACNDRACFPPASAPVHVSVKVVGPGVSIHSAHAAVFEGARSN